MVLDPSSVATQDAEPFRRRLAFDVPALIGVSTSLAAVAQPHVSAEKLDRDLTDRPAFESALRLDLAVEIVGDFHGRFHHASKPYSRIAVKGIDANVADRHVGDLRGLIVLDLPLDGALMGPIIGPCVREIFGSKRRVAA